MSESSTALMERERAEIAKADPPVLEERYFIMWDRLIEYLYSISNHRKKRRRWTPHVETVLAAVRAKDAPTLRTELAHGFMRMRNEQRPNLESRLASLRNRIRRGDYGREITTEELYARIRAAGR